MTDETAGWTGGQRAFGDFAPGLVHYTDRVLFDEVWERPELSKRDRSLITVAALIAGGNAEQLNFHLDFARKNGLAEELLIEAITHLAFYAGWPKAMSAMTVAKNVFTAVRGRRAEPGLVSTGSTSGVRLGLDRLNRRGQAPFRQAQPAGFRRAQPAMHRGGPGLPGPARHASSSAGSFRAARRWRDRSPR